MTDARTEWVHSRERKRMAVSWLTAMIIYGVFFGGLAIIGLLDVVKMDDYSGPIIVRLGSPDGLDASIPTRPVDQIQAPQPATTASSPVPPTAQAVAGRQVVGSMNQFGLFHMPGGQQMPPQAGLIRPLADAGPDRRHPIRVAGVSVAERYARA